MKGFQGNIEDQSIQNTDFRRVLFTTAKSQLVLMSLKPGEDIGEEIHDEDQFFRFEKGVGKVVIDGEDYVVGDGESVIVPAGEKHNVINTSQDQDLKLYTIYSPAHHPDGTVHATRREAMEAEAAEH